MVWVKRGLFGCFESEFIYIFKHVYEVLGKFTMFSRRTRECELRLVSKTESRCVVCGKKIRGNTFKIYSNPKNKELKLYVCTEHKEYIKALDTLKLPSTENKP